MLTPPGAELRPIGKLAPGTLLYTGRFRIDFLLAVGPALALYRVREVASQQVMTLIEFSTPGQIQATISLNRAAPLLEYSHTMTTPIQVIFVENETLFFVMAIGGGQTIEQIMRNKHAPILPTSAIRWMVQAADGIIFLASRLPEWMIGDLSPGSLFVTAEDRLQLLGFAIPLGLVSPAALASALPRGAVAPELRKNQCDTLSDVYGLCASLHYLLTRRLWHPDDPAREEMLADLRPDLSRELVHAIMRGLAENPADRWPTIAMLREALVAALPVERGNTGSPGPILTNDERLEEPPTLVMTREDLLHHDPVAPLDVDALEAGLSSTAPRPVVRLTDKAYDGVDDAVPAPGAHTEAAASSADAAPALVSDNALLATNTTAAGDPDSATVATPADSPASEDAPLSLLDWQKAEPTNNLAATPTDPEGEERLPITFFTLRLLSATDFDADRQSALTQGEFFDYESLDESQNSDDISGLPTHDLTAEDAGESSPPSVIGQTSAETLASSATDAHSAIQVTPFDDPGSAATPESIAPFDDPGVAYTAPPAPPRDAALLAGALGAAMAGTGFILVGHPHNKEDAEQAEASSHDPASEPEIAPEAGHADSATADTWDPLATAHEGFTDDRAAKPVTDTEQTSAGSTLAMWLSDERPVDPTTATPVPESSLPPSRVLQFGSLANTGKPDASTENPTPRDEDRASSESANIAPEATGSSESAEPADQTIIANVSATNIPTTRTPSRPLQQILGRLRGALQQPQAHTVTATGTVVLPRQMFPKHVYSILVRVQRWPTSHTTGKNTGDSTAIIEVEYHSEAFYLPIKRLALQLPAEGGLSEATLTVTALRPTPQGMADRLTFQFRTAYGMSLHEDPFVADIMILPINHPVSGQPMLTLIHALDIPS